MYHATHSPPPESARDVSSLLKFGLTSHFDIASPDLVEYENLAQLNIDGTFPYNQVGHKQG